METQKPAAEVSQPGVAPGEAPASSSQPQSSQTPAAAADGVTKTAIINKKVEVDAQAPSHWLADGHAVILPTPNRLTRRRWIERSILEHGLLQSWNNQDNADAAAEATDGAGADSNNNNNEASVAAAAQELQASVDPELSPAKKEAQQQKIHPLALASARLQNDGINELNRSINLTSLVENNEYFGLTNIVADAALELAAAASSAARPAATAAAVDGTAANNEATAADGGGGDTAGTGTAASPASAPTAVAAPAAAPSSSSAKDSLELQQSTIFQSLYVLKHKHGQFKQAATVLKRHRMRLAQGCVADARPLRRLAQLRHRWRLTAPEHGQRARPHPVRPTEFLAADVATAKTSAGAGRLARRIPRYATIELRKTPIAKKVTATTTTKTTKSSSVKSQETKEGQDMEKSTTEPKHNGDLTSSVVAMDVDEEDTKEKPEDAADSSTKTDTPADQSDEDENMCWTYAEPFALADPTLGKLDADFDPSKIEMLTLQFALEDLTTGVSVSSCLEPTQTLSSATEPDEIVLTELQHSLLCATLFESMRRELADDTEEVGQIRTSSQQLYKNVVWLADSSGCAAQPYLAAGRPDRRALQVVHAHEGEVCVQLTAQYTLRVQLVPASTKTVEEKQKDKESAEKEQDATSAQLLLLCKILLWEAHSMYHKHFVKEQKQVENEETKAAAAAAAGPDLKMPAHAMASKSAASAELSPPHILQGCVHLGTKILMERKICDSFKEIQAWVRAVAAASSSNTTGPESSSSSPPLTLQIQATPWSVLEAVSMWALQMGQWQANVWLEGGPRLLVDWWCLDDPSETHRKVSFESIGPFGLFLNRQIRHALRQQQQQQQQQQQNGTAAAAENGHATSQAQQAVPQAPPPPAAAPVETA